MESKWEVEGKAADRSNNADGQGEGEGGTANDRLGLHIAFVDNVLSDKGRLQIDFGWQVQMHCIVAIAQCGAGRAPT